MKITPLHPCLGARVEGVDVAASVDEAAFREIFDAFQEHCWRQWDLVMWDNRCVLHRGRPWDATRHKRVMRRTTIAGEGPTAQPPLATRTPAWDGIVAASVGA